MEAFRAVHRALRGIAILQAGWIVAPAAIRAA
jgi:hypothetical protein